MRTIGNHVTDWLLAGSNNGNSGYSQNSIGLWDFALRITGRTATTRLLALVLALATLAPTSFGQVRTWTDATGRYGTKAEFDGVSFFGSWYVTGGTLHNPNYLGTRQWWRYCLKDLYGWREGVEDVQYLEMVEDASVRARGAGGRRLAAAYHRALKRVVDQRWWAKDPLLLEEAIKASRRELAEALLGEKNRK